MSRHAKYVFLIIVAVIAMVMGVASSFSLVESEEWSGERETRNESVYADADYVANEGIISEAPQVPVTVPVRRVIATMSSNGMSVSRIIRSCYNLTIAQLACKTDFRMTSLKATPASVFAIARTPLSVSRSCEYYVYALRMIVV